LGRRDLGDRIFFFRSSYCSVGLMGKGNVKGGLKMNRGKGRKVFGGAISLWGRKTLSLVGLYNGELLRINVSQLGTRCVSVRPSRMKTKPNTPFKSGRGGEGLRKRKSAGLAGQPAKNCGRCSYLWGKWKTLGNNLN